VLVITGSKRINKELVLLPGMDGTGILFKPFIDALSSSINTTVIDYPTDKKLSYPQLLTYVKTKLPDRRFVLLAESYSGPIAFQLAQDESLKLDKVIFAASFISNPNTTLLSLINFLPLRLILKLPIPSLLIKYFCFGQYITQDLTELFVRSINKVKSDVLADRILSLETIPTPDRNIDTPCLVIEAKNDKLLSDVAQQVILQKCNNYEKISIEGPHFILQTRYQALVQKLSTYIQDN